MLEVKELTTGYRNHTVVDKISFSVNKGELLCIIGPNGCGKSTLLKALNNINDYTGVVKYNDTVLKHLENKELGKVIGMLSQTKSAYFSYSINDTVAMGSYAFNKGLFKVQSNDETVKKALTYVDLYDMKDQKIDQLSGGQFQRTMIARLLVQNPDIIVLDEPTNHLDLKHQVEILTLVKDLIKNEGKIGIIVLHDLNLVYRFADKVILLDLAKNYYIGTPQEILTNDNINKVYDIDVKNWMSNLLKLWE